MAVRYFLDPETGQPHIYGHGVSEWEVEQVLQSPLEDRLAHDGARQALGRAASGRFLKVLYVPDADRSGFFVVTAHELTGKPLKALRRRRKGRRP